MPPMLVMLLAVVGLGAQAGAATNGLDPSFAREGIYRLDLTEPSLDVANATSMGVVAGSAGGRFALAALGGQFGGGGQRIVDFGRPSVAHAVVGQTSRLVAAGGAGDDFAVAFLEPNGDSARYVPDQGKVRTSFGAPAVAYGLAAMAENEHVAVGTVQAGAGSSLAMARYDSTGRLDPSFGSGGKVVVDVTAGQDSAYAVIRPPSSELVLVAGQAGPDALVARFLPDGSPDPTFGSGGRLVLDVSPGNDVARTVGVSTRGFLVAGAAGSQAFVAALTANGALDPSFGDGGIVRTTLGGTAARASKVIEGDGKVFLAGTVTGPGGDDAVVARFGLDGRVDLAFGTAGRTVLDLGGPSDQANDMTNGYPSLRLVGGDGADMVSVSVSATDGSPGAGGRLVVDFGEETYEWASGVATLPDGRIVVAGSGTRGMVLARLLANGAPDPSFGRAGVSVTPVDAYAEGVAIVGGRVHVLARRQSGVVGIGVFRFSADGVLDQSYGNDGFAYTDLRERPPARPAMAVLPDGGLVLGSGNQVVRLAASGEVTAQSGVAFYPDAVVGLAPQPDGRVVVMTETVNQVGARLVRLNTDGTRDHSFGQGGLVGNPLVADPGAILRLADGRFAVGGRVTTITGAAPAAPDLFLAGFTAEGELDQGFGSGGATRTADPGVAEVVALTQHADGRIVSVFRRDEAQAPSDVFGLARYLPDGRLDTSFGTGGVTSVVGVEPAAAALTGDGKVLVAGRAGADLAVARALPSDTSAPAAYHPVAPVRLLDTRTGLGAPAAAKLGPAATVGLQVSGRDGVPLTGVSAVVLNVTATEPSDVSFLTAWPAGEPRPLASNLNVSAGQTVANLVVVKTGAGGRVNLYNHSGATHVVADLAGWYGTDDAGPGARYATLTPARILDTRSGVGATAASVGPGSTLRLQVTGRGGVPATGVSAVVLNVTATDPTAVSYLTAWPGGAARPLASNLNYTAGQTVPNLVIVKVSPTGAVDLYNNAGAVHLIADVAGWYGPEGGAAGALYSPVVPARVLDTRSGLGAPAAKVGPGGTVALQVTGRGGIPASGVSAVVLNVTATEPTAVSFLTVWPAGEARPLASSLNYVPGQTVPNLVVVKVGEGGRVHLYNHLGSVHVVADVAGWYGI